MKANTLRLVAILGVLALAAGGYAWLRTRDGGGEQVLRTARLERGPLQAVVAASGTLNAVTTVQVGSQISGQVKEIYADFNTSVKKNQVIARIDPATFELRVAQASADLDAAKSAVAVARSTLAAQQAEIARVRVNLGDAQRDYERKRSLVEQKFISPAELDKARTLLEATREQLNAVQAQIGVNESQVTSALASVKQRESLLRQAQVDLDRTIIRAPVDGTVILRNIDAGQTVAASLQAPVLFTIAQDLRDMQVEAAIDEADVGRLRVGMPASFAVDAFPRRSFSGQIVQILDYLQVPYKGINVLESGELREGIKTYSQWPTIPQLYVKGEFVGGCDIVREMFQAGELQSLLLEKGLPVQGKAIA